LFICATAALALYPKCEETVESTFKNGERIFTRRHAILTVAGISSVVSLIALIPEKATMLAFLLCFAMFLLARALSKKWLLSIVVPTVFIMLYLFSWNTLFLNLFSTITVVFSTAIFGASLALDTEVKDEAVLNRGNILSGVVLFVALIVLADVTLVFGTNLMMTAATKIEKLQLPLQVIVPTFPSTGGIAHMGLGDILISGLLAILTANKWGMKSGILCVASISATIMLGTTVLINCNVGMFPATILVVVGWLAGTGMRALCQWLI
jgi:hypothetical protein